ncbi:MAG TPA: EAL domain-containing protein [Polyangiaceae bacterium]|nr:EAL domain-containing protein [Polyangiaceae bacterium]
MAEAEEADASSSESISQVDVTAPRTVRSLTEDDLSVVFQPIVDLSSKRIFAHEVLVRCSVQHFIDPTILFEHAVREGACGRLGRAIRKVAFRSPPKGLPMFVNLHPDELVSRWLVRPDDPIYFHDAPLFLEITESAAIEYFDLCSSVLKEVCWRSGAGLAVDDFGAGHANVTRVLDLCPSVVKLDRGLISGLDKSPRKQTIVKHLVAMCHELDAAVVVEGIETLDELKAVADTGARYAQGFVFGRPSINPLGAE